MKNKVLFGLAAIVMVAIVFGCGKKPLSSIKEAKAAVEAAKTAEAAVYLPEEFAAVEDSLNAIMTSVTAQDSKLFKNFGDAKGKLEETVTLANQVAENVAAKKEAVKKELETLMTEIAKVIAEDKTLLTKAPRGKEGVAVLEQIKTDIATIEASVVEARKMYDDGLFMDALNKVKAGKERADGINAELKEAIAKVNARR